MKEYTLKGIQSGRFTSNTPPIELLKRGRHRDLMKSNVTPPLPPEVKEMTARAVRLREQDAKVHEKVHETKRLLRSLTISEEHLTLEILRELYGLPRNWGYVAVKEKHEKE